MAQSELLVSTTAKPTGTIPTYSLLVASDDTEVRAAQRLRYQVFGEELGANLLNDMQACDSDEFDRFCDHLIVRHEPTGEIVGTYRMLPPHRAEEAGHLYSDTEFDLGALARIRPALVETGRSCVHPEHRSGAVVGLIWAGIARYLLRSGHSWLAGCASVPVRDGGELAAGVWDVVSHKHLAPVEYRVTPREPWPVGDAPRPAAAVIPPLLRGYLRLGAWVCGPPAYDADFGVADFFVLLNMDRIDRRYLRFFLGGPGFLSALLSGLLSDGHP